MSSLQQGAAGSLVRIFDGMSDWERPWLPCSVHGGCTAPHRKEGDRWPASYLNRRHGGTYSDGDGGIVVSAEKVRLLCGYAQDGRSMEKDCEAVGGGGDCVPGCTPHTQWCVDTRCLNLRYEKE